MADATKATVCAIGDLLLDVVCRRLAPINPDTDTPSIVRPDAGGQAANVAAWAVAAGANGRLITVLADDPAGRLARDATAARGVELVGPVLPGPSGCIVVLVGDDDSRSMLTDRGAAPDLPPDSLDPAWLDGVDVLHVTGYALAGGGLHEAARRAVRWQHARGRRVAVELSSTALIDTLGADAVAASIRELAPHALFATAAEAARLGGARLLGTTIPVVVEKHGADGATVHADGIATSLPAAPAPTIVDTTGAGDALAGAFHAAWAGGADPVAALRAALPFAARCVGRMGAQPVLA